MIAIAIILVCLLSVILLERRQEWKRLRRQAKNPSIGG